MQNKDFSFKSKLFDIAQIKIDMGDFADHTYLR